MLTRQETYERLKPVNRAMADRYFGITGNLTLSEAELHSFSEQCLAIAEAGWRSFESVNALLDVAPRVGSTDVLLQVCRTGGVLLGYSFEPALNYFRSVAAAYDHEQQQNLAAFETCGLSLHTRLPHASGLVAGFFRTGSVVLGAVPSDCFADWLGLFESMQEMPREALNRFLSASERCPDAPWGFIAELGQRAEPAVIDCLDVYPKLVALLPVAELRSVQALMLKFADETPALCEALLPFLEYQRSARFDSARLDLVFQLLADLRQVAEVKSLLNRIESLPLDQPNAVRAWLNHGLTLTADNPAATLAYLAGESAASVSQLESVRGQVNFEDHKRLFDLVAEAMTGQQVTIESYEAEVVADPHDNLRGWVMPAFDGRTVHLPEAVVMFDQQEQNLWYFKVSLYHQLGYVEFGCYQAISQIAEDIAAASDAELARQLFQIIEDARVDWQLADKFPGLAPHLIRQKVAAVQRRTRKLFSRKGQLLEGMLLHSLDGNTEDLIQAGPAVTEEAARLRRQDLQRLTTWMNTVRHGSVLDVLKVMAHCHDLINEGETSVARMSLEELRASQEMMPDPVNFRGELSVDDLRSTFKVDALIEEIEDILESEPDQSPALTVDGDPDNPDIDELTPGEVPEGVGIVLTDLQQELGEDMSVDPLSSRDALQEFLGGIGGRSQDARKLAYDEWDHSIGDYRKHWCTLFEHRELAQDEDYVRKTLLEHQALARRIRQQLNQVRPENLKKVKGVSEGEELDMERSLDYLMDRRAGLSPSENIYVQRQRKERDVSTLFLLDMSASTDDIVPDPAVEPLVPPEIDDDEAMAEYFRLQRVRDADARRIIDLEKESVILMAEALDKLGDSYSICGFSGYGREQVDYFLCKDFDETFDQGARARVGGIKPCRSTRMGAPIRHATRSLLATGARIKALIIISDGYPQDHDYGADRNSKDYGLMDTMKALSEARQQGVLSYCLTVDPSGHDYLRAMCPDSQYMVIQDIEQLPEELSRVYRSLTG